MYGRMHLMVNAFYYSSERINVCMYVCMYVCMCAVKRKKYKIAEFKILRCVVQVKRACEEYGITMAFTDLRLFHH